MKNLREKEWQTPETRLEVLKGFVLVRYTVLRCANLRTPRTGVWAVLYGLGSMDPDPHLVLNLSLTVFLLELLIWINSFNYSLHNYFNEFIQLLSTQLLSTQLNDIGLCLSFWISTNKLTTLHASSEAVSLASRSEILCLYLCSASHWYFNHKA